MSMPHFLKGHSELIDLRFSGKSLETGVCLWHWSQCLACLLASAAIAGEVAVYKAYLEAGFRGVIPSLIGEVSSFFGFCPSQLTNGTPIRRITNGLLDLYEHIPAVPTIPKGVIAPDTPRGFFDQRGDITGSKVIEPHFIHQRSKVIRV
ncbi:hypothetical protein YC2023_074861 [Brassica napus]